MVQQPQAVALTLNDYLIPLTTIRDTLLHPSSSSLSPDTLLQLLQHHLPLLQDPARPFPAAPKSSSNLPSSITIPGTSTKLELAETTRKLAVGLAERTQAITTTCAVLAESYVRNVSSETTWDETQAGRDDELLRLSVWFTEQALAVPQIVAALQHVSADETNLYADVAATILPEVLGDADKFIEGLFRGWSGLAQQEIQKQDRGDATEALFRATHQLRRQEHVLALLFLILYHTPLRLATTSEGLIRGVVMSAFGTYLANRDIWGFDSHCQALGTRIRDLTAIIGLEALCLNQALVSEDEEESLDGTLLQDKSRVDEVHRFLLDQSEELSSSSTRDTEEEISAWPISVLCGGWSVALNSLPAQRRPSASGGLAHQEMARRALSGGGRIWIWLSTILCGPLLGKEELAGFPQLSALLRKSVKDLLMGLTAVVNLEAIAERGPMYDALSSMFGSGSDSASSLLCEDFWAQDFPHDSRRKILDTAHFPAEPTHLPDLLTALSGPEDASADPQSCLHAVRYFNFLTTVAFAAPPTAYKFIGKDGAGRMMVEATRDIVLPGAATIAQGDLGVILASQNEAQQIVSWTVSVPGWGMLVGILRAAAGIQSDDVLSPPSADFVHLSATELGIRSTAEDILNSGFKWLARALDPFVGEAKGILTSLDQPHLSGLGSIVQLVIGYLDSLSSADLTDAELEVAIQALNLLSALLYIPSSFIWSAIRTSGLFAVPGKRKSIAIVLLQADASRLDHRLAMALIRLIETIATLPPNIATPEPVVVRSALHFLVTDVWNTHTGWRYTDPAGQHEMSDQLTGLLDAVLRNPYSADGQRPTDAAQYLIESFITSASPFIYQPILENFTRSLPALDKLLSLRKTVEGGKIVDSLESSIEHLQTLFRLAATLGTQAIALPFSLVNTGTTTENGDPIQLQDFLYDVAISASTPRSTRILLVKLLRTYLEAVRLDSARPSLAGILKNAESTLNRLVESLIPSKADLQIVTWDLLSSVIATQPGCVHFVTDQSRRGELGGALKLAVDEILRWEELEVLNPQKMSAVLRYILAVYQSPSATRHTERLRKNNDFWTAIHDIATRPVVPAPSFALSLHAEDFASRIAAYAHATRAKGHAVAILAAELAVVLDSDNYQGENKAQSLILTLFRNKAKLEVMATAAICSSCYPELHEGQVSRLQQHQIDISSLRTVALQSERDYGTRYMYDAQPRVPGNVKGQSMINLALDLLNLNWSMMDADLGLTRAFSDLYEVASGLLQGDGNAARAAQAASLSLVAELAEESRGGDVMLAIQTQRLGVLANLLDIALDSEVDLPASEEIVALSSGIRGIVETPIFPPIISLRNPELAPVHQPILRILSRFFGRVDWQTADPRVDEVLECSTVLALEAADLVFERVLRSQSVKPTSLVDSEALCLILGVLSEITRAPATSLWLNRMAEMNVVARSLEAVVRVRVDNDKDTVPVYLPSVLLLHLALAGQAASAEKLAISGLLPAYTDNAITLLAEAGKIVSPATTSFGRSVHEAWCGMLEVIKALLTSLPPTSVASFVRTDVVPFLRVCTNQVLRALSWDGESRLTVSQLQELELINDVFFGASQFLGSTDGTLQDFAPAAISLLKSLRHVFSHPRQFLTLLVPDSEDEHAGLEAELKRLEDSKEPDLLDFQGFPILADRTRRLLGVARTTVLTLVNLSDAWNTLKNEHDTLPSNIIEDDTEPFSASADPIGVLNDLHLLVLSLTSRIPPAAYNNPLVLECTKTCVQISEAALLVSTAQILLRHAAFDGNMSSGSMDVDIAGGRRRGDRREAVLRELIGDVEGLTGLHDGDIGGEEGIKGWLGRTLELRLRAEG